MWCRLCSSPPLREFVQVAERLRAGLFRGLLDLFLTFFGQFSVPRHLGDDLLGFTDQLVLDLAHSSHLFCRLTRGIAMSCLGLSGTTTYFRIEPKSIEPGFARDRKSI